MAVRLIFVHGVLLPTDRTVVEVLSAALADRGVPVTAYQLLSPPLEDPALEAALLRGVRASPDDGPTVLCGWSLGARIAVQVAERAQAAAVVCVGYPFHDPQDPTHRHGLLGLQGIQVPTLIVQGARDRHGNREQVRGYELPAAVKIHWFEDSNHALKPRERSARTQEDNLLGAAQRITEFVQGLR